jgi:hypothetical protein
MTFLEVLCVGMSGYLAFYAVRSGTCAGPVDRGRRDPSCNLPVCHGWVVGYG